MFCQNCGAQINEKAVVCVRCGCSVVDMAAASASDDNSALRLLVPIGRSGWAIAAGYLGLFSLIPFVGILALTIGIVAVNDLKKNPHKHGAGRAWFGIIAGSLSLLFYLIAIIGAAAS